MTDAMTDAMTRAMTKPKRKAARKQWGIWIPCASRNDARFHQRYMDGKGINWSVIKCLPPGKAR